MQRTLLSLAVFAALTTGGADAADNQTKTVVTPSATTAAASRVSGIDLQWIDQSVRPQDDFFQYMSGKWLAEAEIPADRARFGSFDQLRELSEKRSFDIIKALSADSRLKAGSNEKKIADLYNSFMDEARADKLDIQPLQSSFERIDRLMHKEDLPALISYLGKMGISLPVQSGIGQDARDSSKYAVYLSQGGLGLPDRDYYLKDDDAKLKGFRDAYLKHVETMLAMSGQKEAEKAAASILALETEIARIQWSKVENRNPVKTYNKIEIAKLTTLLPGFDWTMYFAGTGVGKRVDYVIVRQPDFLSNLAKIISDTPVPVWRTYFKWKLLDAYASLLSKRFVDEDFQFSSVVLRGIPANQPRWKRGVARVEDCMPEALGKLYVARYFPPENKVRMEQLVSNLTLAYKQSIETLEWMSPETKQEALTKLSKFTPKIGYPDVWRDYSKLDIRKDDLVGNIMRARAHEYHRQLAKLGQPVNRKEWGMSPQTVNAYYNSRQNEIVFPAAILQPPFFNPAADDAVNYGGIGAVIGHEISHGFDDSGSQSDGDGNLRDWWTKEDKTNFSKLTTAMIAQYNAYSPLPGYHVNGALTLGENIADNSGLSIAYKAYQLSLGGKPAPVIDGYTGDQRLFMGWAQVWRGKARDAETIRLLNIDPHSPASVRGNAPLTNIPGFYAAFGVKEGDKMYIAPEKRITIW
ncbi:M13 family metallopeptidase [Undibacterium oligocarboniphilum]|uniref:M13 family peptidase n=1 Tax=Undibacterium oligocarboniphilum TaxID=666702 RepID=A0A850QN24_9BURK|nr:M13-type metalloendopeptidase [Undibacterium oligocarboniphilum]MBC3871586.1 M13 family peptidase [Undibacterium oligocarboniphilum]NVO79055.1 M13 family peptidase [Undibacterium oligocarboniphilum]